MNRINETGFQAQSNIATVQPAKDYAFGIIKNIYGPQLCKLLEQNNFSPESANDFILLKVFKAFQPSSTPEHFSTIPQPEPQRQPRPFLLNTEKLAISSQVARDAIQRPTPGQVKKAQDVANRQKTRELEKKNKEEEKKMEKQLRGDEKRQEREEKRKNIADEKRKEKEEKKEFKKRMDEENRRKLEQGKRQKEELKLKIMDEKKRKAEERLRKNKKKPPKGKLKNVSNRPPSDSQGTSATLLQLHTPLQDITNKNDIDSDSEDLSDDDFYRQNSII